jgi:hypothetical protein
MDYNSLPPQAQAQVGRVHRDRERPGDVTVYGNNRARPRPRQGAGPTTTTTTITATTGTGTARSAMSGTSSSSNVVGVHYRVGKKIGYVLSSSPYLVLGGRQTNTTCTTDGRGWHSIAWHGMG